MNQTLSKDRHGGWLLTSTKTPTAGP